MMRAVLIAALLCVINMPAHAASEADVKRDCAGDAVTYCWNAIPKGRKAIIACMLRNRAKLSPACATHMHD